MTTLGKKIIAICNGAPIERLLAQKYFSENFTPRPHIRGHIHFHVFSCFSCFSVYIHLPCGQAFKFKISILIVQRVDMVYEQQAEGQLLSLRTLDTVT